ncbi:MAG: hypothetical protein VX895_02195 [Chloroflexota bacterium]|nr:hypothetical protein [Chloroflexota bacterium]
MAEQTGVPDNRETPEGEQESCVICGDALDGIQETSCQMCGGKFHQPWSHDSSVPQCGRIGSHEDALAIVFLCDDCYYGRRP